MVEALRVEAILDIATVKGVEKLEKQIAKSFKGTFAGNMAKSLQGVTSQMSGLSDIAKQAGIAGGAAKGAGAAAGGMGAGMLAGTLMAVLGVLVLIKGMFDIAVNLIDKGIRASTYAQETINAYLKLIGLIMKPIGDIIGGAFYSLIRIMLPYVRLQMALWRPFQQQMMEGIQGVLKATDDPLRRMSGIFIVLLHTMASFGQVMQAMVTTEIVKAIVDMTIKTAQVFTVVIGGLAITMVRAFFTLAKLIAGVLGGPAAAGAVGTAETAMVSGVSTGFAAMVGLLEVLNQTAQLSADMYFAGLVQSILTNNEVLNTLTGNMSNWGTALGGLAGTFDAGFGMKIKSTITAIEAKAQELSLQLDTTGFDLQIIGTIFSTLMDTLITEVTTDSALIQTDWQKMFLAIFSTTALEGQKVILSIEEMWSGPGGIVPTFQLWAKEVYGGWKGLLTKIGETISPVITWIGNQIDTIKSYVDKAKDLLSDKDNGSGGGFRDDFVMRPGQGAVSFSPKDTIIGVKNPGALLGGGRGGNNFNITVNVHGQKNTKELVREISKELQYELRGRLSYGIG